MPGCLRHSLPHMLKEVEEAWKFGVRTFVVFPKVRVVSSFHDSILCVRSFARCRRLHPREMARFRGTVTQVHFQGSRRAWSELPCKPPRCAARSLNVCDIRYNASWYTRGATTGVVRMLSRRARAVCCSAAIFSNA